MQRRPPPAGNQNSIWFWRVGKYLHRKAYEEFSKLGLHFIAKTKKKHIYCMMEPIHSFQSPTEVCWQRHCEVMIIFSLFLSFQTNRVCWRSPSRKGQLWQHFRYMRMALSCVTSWHVVALHQHTKRHLSWLMKTEWILQNIEEIVWLIRHQLVALSM